MNTVTFSFKLYGRLCIWDRGRILYPHALGGHSQVAVYRLAKALGVEVVML